MLYPGELGTELGYDLYVKDRPDGEEWVCYDSLPDDVRLDMDGVEREMAGVLDREVQRRGLSYTKCPFERVEGKTRVAKKPEMAEPRWECKGRVRPNLAPVWRFRPEGRGVYPCGGDDRAS